MLNLPFIFNTNNSHKYKFELVAYHSILIDKHKYPNLSKYVVSNNGLHLSTGLICLYYIDEYTEIMVSNGFAWDGCSPKFRLGKLILGTWDGKDNAFAKASMYHDIWCQLKTSYKVQKEADKLFRDMLIEAGCSRWLANLYYAGVSAWSYIDK